MRNNYGNNLPLINLYSKRNSKSKVDTQLIYGDNFKVLKRYGKWNKIKNKTDGYIGFIKNKKYTNPIKANFKVSVLKANIFSKPNSKSKLNKVLPFNSRLKIIKRIQRFSKFEKYWIKNSDLKRITYKNKDIFNDVKLFKNLKYLWGGKSYKGIDCSALIQICFNQNNRYCPRDSVDQEKYFKKKSNLKI